MDIEKSNDNFKDRKPKCFNCNKYSHIDKKCWKKKEKETQKCFKCDKEGHIVKDCKEKQSIKNQMIKTTKRIIKSRVLEKILSRHSTRYLYCKFSEQIYYS